jgi:hypothetical protein
MLLRLLLLLLMMMNVLLMMLLLLPNDAAADGVADDTAVAMYGYAAVYVKTVRITITNCHK